MPENSNEAIYHKSSPRNEGTVDPATAMPEEVAEEPEPVAQPVSNEPQLTDIYVIAQDLIAWGRIRQKITNTELITNIRIKSFTAGKAFITLTHKGDFADVVTALESVGLEVSRGAKYWEVREKM